MSSAPALPARIGLPDGRNWVKAPPLIPGQFPKGRIFYTAPQDQLQHLYTLDEHEGGSLEIVLTLPGSYDLFRGPNPYVHLDVGYWRGKWRTILEVSRDFSPSYQELACIVDGMLALRGGGKFNPEILSRFNKTPILDADFTHEALRFLPQEFQNQLEPIYAKRPMTESEMEEAREWLKRPLDLRLYEHR